MSIISFLGLGSVFDTKLPIFGWLYDSIHKFVKEFDSHYEKNYTGEIRKELERQLYLIVSDHIHERLYQGVHRDIEEKVRLALIMRYNDEEIRKAVNYMSKSGEYGTAMHYVTCEGYAMILRILLERRGNPNLQAMNEETPLQKAIVLYNETEQDFKKEAYLRVISVLLCFQADRQRLKPGTPRPQPAPIEDEFKKQIKSNEKGHMSTIANKMRKGVINRDIKKVRKALNNCNLGLLNLISSQVPEFDDLTFEIGALFYAVKWNSRAAEYFNRTGELPNASNEKKYEPYMHKIDGSLVNTERQHPSIHPIKFLDSLESSYHYWGLDLRADLQFLKFLTECFEIIFSHLHRTPEDNPKNGANLLHYFILIPYYPLCQSVLAHSPELIHRQDCMGNTPLHCAFFRVIEEEAVYLPILDKVVSDDYMMHFFNFDKFNLARQTILHLISERGTKTNKTVKIIGEMICSYISEKIKENRHLKVDLNIADSNGWTPFLQLCYKNDPLAITMAEFAHEQVIDINLSCPNTKYTALHHAVRYRNDRICELLLAEDNFKDLRVTSFDLISKRASLKLIEMGFKYAPSWAIKEYMDATKASDVGTDNSPPPNAEKMLLKRLTSHQPSDREYGDVVLDDMINLTASPLLEVLIIEWTELFESIVYHASLEVVDSCRGLKFALELGYDCYVKPLVCNLVGVTKEKIKRRVNNSDTSKRLLMDFHDGHLNTWCLENILNLITADNFIFDKCPKVPEHLRNSLDVNLTFNHVVSIDLSGNSLDRIPDCLLFLTEVTNLNLLNNDIELIPDVSTNNLRQPLPALKELNISSNRLGGLIPLWIICHKNLEKLFLTMNKLDFVGDNNFDMLGIKSFNTKLRVLHLQRNKLTFIPRYFQHLKEISDLNMSNNEIIIVPTEIWMLFKLTSLDLAENSIIEIEFPCKNMSFKDQNEPSGNQDIIFEGQRKSEDYCHLSELKLAGNELKEPPNGLVCITPKLQRLNVKDNKKIKYLDLRYLPKFLRYLDYSGCGIKHVIFTSESRPCFASSSNVIQHALCDHLKHRHVKFLFLNDFYLNGNKELENIILGKEDDKEMLYFPSLKYLHLHENNLLQLPPHIGYQKNLETLDISDNKNLKRLPKELGNLKIYKRLQSLRKDNLELFGIDKEASLPVVLNILRSIGTECDYNRRFKLALVGYQGRGKTTLLKTLQSKSINDILSTEGIDINKWELIKPDDKSKKIEFEAWDFAGQQDYYPTHHCFLSPRSVYLLVFRACDRQKGISELDGWLKSLEMMAPGCPVLLVGTHIDEIEQESLQNLAQEILQKYHPDKGPFPMIADICFITCKPGLIASNKEQVKSLKNAIYEVASHLHVGSTSNQVTYKPKFLAGHPNAFINQKVPLIYKKLEQRIVFTAKDMKNNNHPPFVNFQTMWDKIGSELFQDKDLLQDGLEYLHHLGLVLNFETSRLRDIYFLDPQWLSKSMAILIRDHNIQPSPENHEKPPLKQLGKEENTNEIFLRKLLDTGIVDAGELKLYLHNKNQQLCDWIDTYVELLERFEVVLRIDNDQILVPSFLPDRQIYTEKTMIDLTKLNKVEADSYHLRRLWFLDHVPYGFWARFISRLRGDETIQELFNIKAPRVNTNIKYCLSKSAFEILYKGCTLLEVLMDESSTINRYDKVPGLIKHYYSILVHINLVVWSVFTIDTKNFAECSTERSIPDPIKIIDLTRDRLPDAAILLHKLSDHYKTLLSNWYRNMTHFVSTEDSKRDPLIFYTPCPKCSDKTEDLDDKEASIRAVSDMSGSYIYFGKKRINIFSSEECIKSKYGTQMKMCHVHGWDKFEVVCPDLFFFHMGSIQTNSSCALAIHPNDILGVGGFGLVCRGTLLSTETKNIHEEVHTYIYDDNPENDVGQVVDEQSNKSCLEFKPDNNNLFPHNDLCYNDQSENPNSLLRKYSQEDRNEHQTEVQSYVGKQRVALKFLVKYPDQKAENFSHFLREEKYTDQDLLEMHSSILNEMSFCIKLNHKNVVQLLGVGFHSFFYLTFELAPLGSLKNILEKYINHSSYIQYDTILRSLEEFLTGLLYLHEELKIIHMDLKPDNLLVWKYPLPSANDTIMHDDVHLKIADYGLVYVYSNMGNKLRAAMGTPGYMAPEVISKTTQSLEPTADIYAVGIIIYQLLTVTTTPADLSELNYFEERVHHFPLLLHSMVRVCVELDPEKRASSRELLDWIRSPEMSYAQLHVAIKLGRFKSIIRTYYSLNLLVEPPEQVNQTYSHEQDSTLEGHWKTMDDGGIEFDVGHSNSLESQDVLNEKEMSMNSIEIAKDTMPARRIKSLLSRSKHQVTTVQSGLYPYSQRPILHFIDPPLQSQLKGSSHNAIQSYINSNFEGLDDLIMPGGEMAENYTCQHACQMFVSYEKLEQSEERCLSFLSINSNQDMSIKLYECKKVLFKSRVNAICIIKNSMWLGTDKGEIIIYPDMQQLQQNSSHNSKPFFKAIIRDTTSSIMNSMYILDLQHLQEWKCVIATTSLGDIFWINDDVQDKGLTTKLHCHLSPRHIVSAINRVHIIRKNNEIQIWCTRGNIPNPLTIVHLPIIKEPMFRKTDLKSPDIKQPLQHITSATFLLENTTVTKVWTSVMNRSIIVCWDVDKINEPMLIDVTKALKTPDNSMRISIKSLLATKERLYVGTNDGCILTYCVNGNIRSIYRWFLGNVRHIVQLPPEIEWCLNRNAFFPINSENFKCASEGTYSESILLAALGEGLDILRKPERWHPWNKSDSSSDTIVFTIWRELEK